MHIHWSRLIVSIAIVFFAGAIGSVFTSPAIDSWYVTITKPAFNPPNYVFGPVWTTLYILIGVSFYLIWNKKSTKKATKKRAYQWFFVQLVLNTVWSIIFFGFKSPLFAGIEIILLALSIAITIYYFSKLEKKASYLLVPYLIWVLFASFLNLSIILLN